MTNPNNMHDDVDDLVFGGGSPSAVLKDIGQSVEGFIVGKRKRQAREYNPNEPGKGALKFYEDGRPIEELVLDLRTEQRDPSIPNDDGVRSVYFKSTWKRELARVLKNAGEDSIPLGGWLRIVRTHDEPGKGAQPKKLVSIEYRSAADVSVTGTPQAAPQPVQAPVQQAPVAAPTQQPAQPAPTANPLAGLSPELIAAFQQLQAQQQ